MFKVECEKIVKYDLKISEDIVKFCQWILDTEQDDVFNDSYTIVDFLDDVANEAPHFEFKDSEINIEYYK